MGTTNHSHASEPVQVNHETTDVTLVGVTRIAVVSLVVLAVILAAVYGMMLGFEWYAADTRALPPLSAVKPGQDRLPSGTALLQPDEPSALRQLRQHESDVLDHYAWVDKAQGTVRLPIARAMELLVEKPELAGGSTAAAATPATTTPAAPPPAPGTPAGEKAPAQPPAAPKAH